MSPSHSIRADVQKIDEQIINLLAERVTRCRTLHEEGEAIGPEDEMEIVATWEEAADEKGLSIGTMVAIARSVSKLCRTTEE